MAEELKPLMMGLDKDIPVITSHSLVGMVAVACGFKCVKLPREPRQTCCRQHACSRNRNENNCIYNFELKSPLRTLTQSNVS